LRYGRAAVGCFRGTPPRLLYVCLPRRPGLLLVRSDSCCVYKDQPILFVVAARVGKWCRGARSAETSRVARAHAKGHPTFRGQARLTPPASYGTTRRAVDERRRQGQSCATPPDRPWRRGARRPPPSRRQHLKSPDQQQTSGEPEKHDDSLARFRRRRRRGVPPARRRRSPRRARGVEGLDPRLDRWGAEFAGRRVKEGRQVRASGCGRPASDSSNEIAKAVARRTAAWHEKQASAASVGPRG